MQNQSESLLDLVVLLYKWKKQIIGASLIAAIIAAGISLLLPNYYEASTQFYAASPDLARPSPIGNFSDNKRIYGDDNDVDRLISIAKSNVVSNFLIDSFDLYNHYDIDTSDSKAKYKLLLKLGKYFQITKTKYDAIMISIEDKSPEVSAAMANACRDKVDELATQLIKKSQGIMIEGYENNVMAKQMQYNSISDSLYQTRVKYNVFNTQSQGEAYGMSLVSIEGGIQNYKARIKYLRNQPNIPSDSITVFQAKLEGLQNEFITLNKGIQDYNSGYPKILKFERELKDFGDQMNLDKERLKQLEAAYLSETNAIHVVEKAEKPVIKSRPKRSFLVVGVAILTLVLMSLWVIVQEEFNKNNWRDKFNQA